MYLITYDQFNDVVLQENSHKVDGTRLIPRFEQLASESERLLPGVKTYRRLLLLGKQGGYSILTFTTDENDAPPIAPPSESYVKIIVAGIKETYPSMKDQEIVEYLLRADGVKGRIDRPKLGKWVAETEASYASSSLRSRIMNASDEGS